MTNNFIVTEMLCARVALAPVHSVSDAFSPKMGYRMDPAEGWGWNEDIQVVLYSRPITWKEFPKSSY